MPTTGSISGHTYFDNNANSVQEPGEDSLGAGFPVDLYNADGTVFYETTTTDANGNYSFGSLADGTYSIRFQTSNGYRGDQGTMTPDGFNLHTGIVVKNGAATTLDQGFNLGASINGNVYSDVNGNGRLDAQDPGLSGATVTLLDASGHVVATTTTDPNGFWNFSGQGEGQYSVTFDPGPGNVIVGSPDTVTRTLVNGTQFNYDHVLTTSPDKVAASLSGTVYVDANGNHRLDSGEAGIAGANLAVIDGNGYVVATLTTDQNGHYVLPHPGAGQTYRVVVSPPSGYAREDADSATGLTLAAGQALDHVDLGLTAAAPATTDAPPPVTKVVNVVLRGQSNTFFPTIEGQAEAMRQEIEHLLGFDGVNQRVNLVATHDDANFANTEWSGTSLTADWLHPDGSGWASTALERGYLSAINRLPIADRGAPTAIVMLHNEFDSNNTTGLTADRWMSAMRYEAGLARAVLGLDAGDAPYLFVSPIPFAVGASQQPQQNQAIAVGQAELSADPSFNGKVVALQTSDVTMNHDDPNFNGGYHLSAADQQAVYGRAALGIAQEFASSAMPGSPISLAHGDIDNLGPQVTKVAAVSGHPDQLLLTLAFDAASSLQSLGAVAAAGVGWTIRAGYDDATADATGTAAQLVDGNHLLVTFDKAVPTNERLFYTWGSLRLQQNNGPGNGNAIYDDNGLPLSVDPHGLAIGYAAAGGPTIAGTLANQATAQATLNPFATTTLADPNTGATDTLRITVSGAGGTLSGTGLVATNDGAYTLSGSAASITAALQALTFAPSASHTGTTTFALQAVSNSYPTATTDSTTTVVTKPATAGISAALANDTGVSAADGFTTNSVVTGVTDAFASVTLTDETGHVVGSAIADAAGRYTITPTGLADGFHTFAATETYLGATAGRASVSFTLDRAVPAPSSVTLAHDTGLSATDRVTSDASVTVTPAEGGGSLSYVVDGKPVAAYDPSALTDGAHTVGVTQTDAAGNVSAAGSLSFTLDRVAPAAPSVALAHDTGLSATDRVTSDASLTVTPAESGGRLNYVVDGNPVAAYDPSALKDGAHSVAVTQTDAAGNVSAGTVFSFMLDHDALAAPTVILAHDTGLSATDRITSDASLTVTPAAGGGSLSYVVDGKPVAAYDPSALKDGAHTVTVTQTDNAGHVSAADAFNFTLDHTAPTLRADAASVSGTSTTLTGNVLTNDSDASALHLSSMTFASKTVMVPSSGSATLDGDHGSLSIAADGSYSYRPTSAGSDVFTETVLDAAGNASQTTLGVTIANGTKTPIPASLSFAFALTDAKFDFKTGHDFMTAPDGTVTDLTGVGTITFTDGVVQEKDGSPLIDDLYYDVTNPDVWRAHVDPDLHYTLFGWKEGRNPDAFFDTKHYLDHNPDVAAAKINPLLHYDLFGWKEGRDPSASFHTNGYLAANPDVAAAHVDPLAHYLQFGILEDRHLV